MINKNHIVNLRFSFSDRSHYIVIHDMDAGDIDYMCHLSNLLRFGFLADYDVDYDNETHYWYIDIEMIIYPEDAVELSNYLVGTNLDYGLCDWEIDL